MSDAVTTQIGAIAGYISMCMMIVGSIIAVVNRHRIRSSCCGREASVELNIEATTPPEKKPEIKV
jgi:hypothetical protein